MATKTQDLEAVVRETYLQLSYSLLIYLKHVQGTEERRQQERGRIHSLCKQLKNALHKEGSKECDKVCGELERLMPLVDTYYPLESNADELADAVTAIDNEIRKRFAIA